MWRGEVGRGENHGIVLIAQGIIIGVWASMDGVRAESALHSNWFVTDADKGSPRLKSSRPVKHNTFRMEFLSFPSCTVSLRHVSLTRCFRSHWMNFQSLQLHKPERRSRRPHHPHTCCVVCIAQVHHLSPSSLVSPSSRYHSRHPSDSIMSYWLPSNSSSQSTQRILQNNSAFVTFYFQLILR